MRAKILSHQTSLIYQPSSASGRGRQGPAVWPLPWKDPAGQRSPSTTAKTDPAASRTSPRSPVQQRAHTHTHGWVRRTFVCWRSPSESRSRLARLQVTTRSRWSSTTSTYPTAPTSCLSSLRRTTPAASLLPAFRWGMRRHLHTRPCLALGLRGHSCIKVWRQGGKIRSCCFKQHSQNFLEEVEPGFQSLFHCSSKIYWDLLRRISQTLVVVLVRYKKRLYATGPSWMWPQTGKHTVSCWRRRWTLKLKWFFRRNWSVIDNSERYKRCNKKIQTLGGKTCRRRAGTKGRSAYLLYN